MSKAHIVCYEEHERPVSWSEPRRVEAMCELTMPDAKPTQSFHSIEELKSYSTLYLCADCLLKLLERTDGQRWFYIVLPAEKADRINRVVEDL